MRKPYPEYKDSGVEWIGKIPETWKLGKMKYQLSRNDGGIWGEDIINDDECTIVIRSTEITIDGKWDLSNPMKRKLNKEENEKCRLYEGDIIITKSSGSPGHIGKSVIVSKDIEKMQCCFSNFVQRIRFKNYEPRLYHYILNSYVVREQYRFLTQTTTGLGNLNSSTLNDILIPFIPLSEQQKMINYIDLKVNQIEELIEKTNQKIELLKEKRTSLINHCVTKGLNPDVKMKDSGVEWIGEIPNHWSLVQLKYLICKVGSGETPRGGSNVYCDEGIPFLRSQNIQFHGLELDDVVFISKEIHEQMSSSKVIPNDVLFNITGASIGRCFYTTPNSAEYNVNQHVCIIRPNEMILTKFLYYCLRSDLGQTQIYLNNTGSGKEGLNFQNIKSFVLIKISKTEQQQIIDYLDSQTQKTDTLIEKENKRIELLKEYRQSLISEAVTGKIDIRDEVAV